MNYFAQGTPGLGHIAPTPYPVLNILERKAEIPGVGNDLVAMTSIDDVVSIVLKMLDLPAGRWPEECRIIGDLLTLNEATQITERIRGKCSASIPKCGDFSNIDASS